MTRHFSRWLALALVALVVLLGGATLGAGRPAVTDKDITARLRAGKTNSGKGAARMIAQAVNTARAAGVTGQILVRGDSAYGNGVVVTACQRSGARFSLVVNKNRSVAAAIATIGEGAWTPVNYPGAVRDPDTGQWISDAEVAEVPYTAFASTPHAVTARLIVRRVKDARYVCHERETEVLM